MNLDTECTSNSVPVPEFEKHVHKYILFLYPVSSLGFKMIQYITSLDPVVIEKLMYRITISVICYVYWKTDMRLWFFTYADIGNTVLQ